MKTILVGGTLATLTGLALAHTAPILQLTAEGPMGLMSTPRANFRIEAAHGGIQRSARVAADSRHAQVVFGFPDEPWDGIKASAEEKQQAR